ncbi:unnamed protein product [Calypogeia fissa]
MSSARSFHENFYGTPSVDESRRRRGKKRHKADKEEPQNEVVVMGVHYRSFDDDSMAAFVNSSTALVPWNGDSKLLIDRYDVRHLLQDLTGIRRRRARPPSPDATKEELDYERYRDVEGLENPSPPEDELKNEDVTGGGYQRVGFDYGGDQATLKERVEDALFSPPFSVPEHLRLKIPTSTKVHQIMAGTAKYVIEHGGQAEIVLRVKQANNPTFGFLMPDHHDHEYFHFLVAHPEYVGIGPPVQQVEAAEVAVAASSEEAEGGLSLLGTAYGDADEDEEEGDREGEANKDQAEELQAVAAEDIKMIEDVTKEHIDGGSDHGAISNRSSTINLTTTDEAENATKDTGDSLEGSLGSDFSKSAGQSSEALVVRMADFSSGTQEPVPPGLEPSFLSSGEKEGHEVHGLSGDLDNQVLTYKEPPTRLRLIIDKMVEFISRNGKEFEAIVKERDKTDHRFPFFLPWNEYYPYYVKELESARQAQLSAETDVAGIPSASEPPNSLQGQVEGNDEGPDTFLNSVPFWDMSQAVESNGDDGEGRASEVPEHKEDESHNGEGGMGFDAVLAAVRFATRGRPQAVDGNNESELREGSDGSERQKIGSDEAVLAAIRVATGRTKLDSSGSLGEQEISHAPASNGLARKDASDPDLTSTVSGGSAVGDTNDSNQTAVSRGASVGDISDPMLASSSVPPLPLEARTGLDEDQVVVPNVAVKAETVLTGEQSHLTESQLTAPEKRKAERLKKAKLFAAMIKDRNGVLTNPVKFSEPNGISAPNLDGLNQASVVLESTTSKSGGETQVAFAGTERDTREQTGDPQVQVASEADKELVDTSVKQRKHKSKSKDQEEKKRKHRHKREKDTDERRKERKQSPDAGDRGRAKHHEHYQDAKTKEKKHSREPEERVKDSKRVVSEGKLRKVKDFQHVEDRTEEYEEARRERSHYTHEADGRRKESKYGYEAERKKTKDRHKPDSEAPRKEGRQGYDLEEKRREDRHKRDTDRKRKYRRNRHISEDSSGDRYEYDSDEIKKRSHGGRVEYDSDEIRKERNHSHIKRKKHHDKVDESDDNGGEKNDHRSKQSRPHIEDVASAADHASAEGPSIRHRDRKDDRKSGVVSPVKQGASPETNATRVGEEKSTLSSVDVPDDIRAKVRAMLAML